MRTVSIHDIHNSMHTPDCETLFIGKDSNGEEIQIVFTDTLELLEWIDVRRMKDTLIRKIETLQNQES